MSCKRNDRENISVNGLCPKRRLCTFSMFYKRNTKRSMSMFNALRGMRSDLIASLVQFFSPTLITLIEEELVLCEQYNEWYLLKGKGGEKDFGVVEY